MSKTLKACIAAAVLMIALLLIITFVKSSEKEQGVISDKSYLMKSLNNTVVLYKDDEIIKVYDGIVVDALPIADRESLKNGISFKNETDADFAAEDYDG